MILIILLLFTIPSCFPTTSNLILFTLLSTKRKCITLDVLVEFPINGKNTLN